MPKQIITITIDPLLLRRVKMEADKESRTVSSWVEQLVKEALNLR